MAQSLYPLDLPSWNSIRRYYSVVTLCRDTDRNMTCKNLATMTRRNEMRCRPCNPKYTNTECVVFSSFSLHFWFTFKTQCSQIAAPSCLALCRRLKYISTHWGWIKTTFDKLHIERVGMELMVCPFVQWTPSNEEKCTISDGKCTFSHMDRADFKTLFKPAARRKPRHQHTRPDGSAKSQPVRLDSSSTPSTVSVPGALQTSKKRKDGPESDVSPSPSKKPRRNLKVPPWTGFDNTNIRAIHEPRRKYKLEAVMELEDTAEKHVMFVSIQVRMFYTASQTGY